jgi:endonuclease/exonuclease/phosphatase family metal-dependent hydrolase
MTDTLHIATYNIHKGFSFFKRRMVIHELRAHLRTLDADLVFLQECRAVTHATRAVSRTGRAAATRVSGRFDLDRLAYGRNAVYDTGHHGNAICELFPIARWDNEDISEHRFESRGLLHCEIEVPGWSETLHCVCVHLGLMKHHRSRQMRALQVRIERLVPHAAPLIIAGDFNDWAHHADLELACPLGLKEVFEQTSARRAVSRGAAVFSPRSHLCARLQCQRRARAHGHPWARISDHAALTSTIIVDMSEFVAGNRIEICAPAPNIFPRSKRRATPQRLTYLETY